MKNWRGLVLSVCVLGGLSVSCAGLPSAGSVDGNLLQNPGFEAGKVGWADWDNSAVESGFVHGGNKSIRLGKGEGGMGQVVGGIEPATRYELSGWGASSSPGETAYLGVDCLDAAGTKLLGGKFTVTFETSNFAYRSTAFLPPSGTAKIQVYVYNNAAKKADVWLDDLAVRKVGAAPVAVEGARPVAVASHPVVPRQKGLWLWETGDLLASQAKADEFFAFCAAKTITTVYFNTGDGPLLKEKRDAVRSFLKSAHSQGLKVEALDGNMRWVLPENHAIPLSRIQEILDWNAALPPEEGFEGVHHDNEPYTLPGFFEDEQRFGTDYLDLVVKSMDLIQRSGMKLTYAVDIPFWYDEAPVIVNYKGIEQPLSFHILDLVDYVAVMDYRDTAVGSNGMIQHGMQEVAYAAKVGKVAILGAETIHFDPNDKDNPPLITFAEEGEAVLNTELAKVSAHFASDPSFGGVAVHHYGSYRNLRP